MLNDKIKKKLISKKNPKKKKAFERMRIIFNIKIK
jgi:hypothetical protein